MLYVAQGREILLPFCTSPQSLILIGEILDPAYPVPFPAALMVEDR